MTDKEFKNILDKSLFWEYDLDKIDPIKHKRLIMERVITRGNLEQLVAMIHFYGVEAMKKEVVKLKGLDEVSLNFMSIIFRIPLKKFTCFGKKQWND